MKKGGGRPYRDGTRNRIRELRMIPANELVPHPENWRKHPQAQSDALRGLLKDVGIVGACLGVELDDGRIQLVDGHLRRDILQGETVPVLVLDLNPEEVRLVLASFDPLSTLAERDSGRLAMLVEEAGPEVKSEAVREFLEAILQEDEKATKAATSSGVSGLAAATALRPGREYAVIVADDREEWERLKELLQLQPVRRGGYPEGSPFDDIGTERVVRAGRFFGLLEDLR